MDHGNTYLLLDSGTQAVRELAANAANGNRYPAEDYTYEVIVRRYPSSNSSSTESRAYDTRQIHTVPLCIRYANVVDTHPKNNG